MSEEPGVCALHRADGLAVLNDGSVVKVQWVDRDGDTADEYEEGETLVFVCGKDGYGWFTEMAHHYTDYKGH